MTDRTAASSTPGMTLHAEHEVDRVLREQPDVSLPKEAIRKLMVLAWVRGATYSRERSAPEIDRLTKLATQLQRDNSALISRLARYDRSEAGTQALSTHGLGEVSAADAAYLTGASDALPAAKTSGARPDSEALKAVPALAGKKAVVLYFETEQDRDDLVRAIQQAKPGMRAVNI